MRIDIVYTRTVVSEMYNATIVFGALYADGNYMTRMVKVTCNNCNSLVYEGRWRDWSAQLRCKRKECQQ